MKKYLVGTCILNEGNKIKRLLQKLTDKATYDVLVIDDGSTDDALKKISIDKSFVTVITHADNKGAGYCVREIIDYACQKGYEAVFFISGNDKDDPNDLYKLIKAIDAGYDFVQGSRFLKGGGYGAMPVYRVVATKFVHPILFSFVTGRRITDSTNGFRTIRLSLFSDQRINIHQDWLDKYELEPYIFFQAIKLGYKVTEVPVTKIYPPKQEGYTKMKPITGWWSILRPLVFLGLRIKK